MRTRVAFFLALFGLAGMVLAVVGAAAAEPDLPFKAYVPAISKIEQPTQTPVPTPTPEPPPYAGGVSSLYLAQAGLGGGSPVEQRSTEYRQGQEYFEEPTHPSRIAWYSAYGHPGYRANNTIFAAHVDYVGYGAGPFRYLTNAAAGDALYVTMDNGLVYTYTVLSVDLVPLEALDMNAVVFPPLDSFTDRVTLISCGGTFIPNADGYGGSYTSRLILVAERYIP